MKKVKSTLQRITTGVLALVFTATLVVPKTKAVAGVDDAAVGLSALLLYIDATGIETGLAVAGSSAVAALKGGTTALIGEAAAAGALTSTSGVAVTSATAALTTIGAGVIITAGALVLTYEAYMLIKDYVDWLNEYKLTQTGANIVYSADGYCALADGRSIIIPTSSTQYLSQSNAGKYPFFPTGDDGLTFDTGNYIRLDSSVWSYNISSVGTSIAPTDVDGFYAYLYPIGGSPWLFTASTGLKPNGERVLYNSGANNGTAAWGKITDFTTPVSQELTLSVPVDYSQPVMIDGQSLTLSPNYPLSYSDIDIIQGIPQSIADGTLSPLPPIISDPPVGPDLPPTDPDLPPVNPNPPVDTPAEVQPYTVQLGDVFPFCIPFDLYHMVTLFVAEPEAPHAKWEFSLPFAAGTYKVEWDLQEWDEVAALCRKLELVLFCVGLAVVTSKLIKW